MKMAFISQIKLDFKLLKGNKGQSNIVTKSTLFIKYFLHEKSEKCCERLKKNKEYTL